MQGHSHSINTVVSVRLGLDFHQISYKTSNTGKGSYTVSLGSFSLPPNRITYLIRRTERQDSKVIELSLYITITVYSNLLCSSICSGN